MSSGNEQLEQLKEHVDDRFDVLSKSMAQVTEALYKLVEVEQRLEFQNILIGRIGNQADDLEKRIRTLEIDGAKTTTTMNATEKTVGKYDTLIYAFVASLLSSGITGTTVFKLMGP